MSYSKRSCKYVTILIILLIRINELKIKRLFDRKTRRLFIVLLDMIELATRNTFIVLFHDRFINVLDLGAANSARDNK